ncbi:MAG: hypothetical protein PVF59_06970 [Desulfobacterales bacterium]|jgi:hypothetical protein
MGIVLQLIKMAAVLMAAILLGNWFLAEVKSAKALRKPWYAPYLSLPGIAILVIAIILPLMMWFWRAP